MAERRITRARALAQSTSRPQSTTLQHPSEHALPGRFWRRNTRNTSSNETSARSSSLAGPSQSSPAAALASDNRNDLDVDSDQSSELSALSSAADPSISGSSAPTPAGITIKGPDSSKSDAHAKKKRRTSPPAVVTPVLARSHFTSKAPSTSTPNTTTKNRAPRIAVTGSGAPTRSQKSLLIRESATTSRAGSAHVVEDDAPLPPPPPRAGMGEGDYPGLSESDIRRENEILRKEAEHIIQQAELHRQELQKRRDRDQLNGVVPVSGKRNRKPINYNENDNEDEDVDMSDGEEQDRSGMWGETRGGPGPVTSNSRSKSRHSNENGHGNGDRRKSKGFFDEPPKDQSFEAEFDRVQRDQKSRALAQKTSDSVRGPTFAKNGRPAVVLAQGHQNGVASRTIPRDPMERGYHQGMSGLSDGMEIDAQGFVENVKDNLRAILKFYFPERSPRRDAFCERIGRGLAQLGWELTDNADAALLP
ncbi:uncharacterized protein I303_107698 [Kwoniella dejecticola CBS 10117]|uniref:Uncharacterized protein n=1 Tax=Kwoniella dejecticola CBS 10117 TaxID=1296121 RepID=A0AAJ8KVE4_9TREE